MSSNFNQKQPRILITRILPEEARQVLEENGIAVTCWTEDRDMTADELLASAQDHTGLITVGANRIDEVFLKACSHLDIISQFAVGFDNIDVAAATKLGIPIANTPHSVTHATADLAFLLMLAVSRKATFHYRRILEGHWRQFEPTAHLGIELRGKTLGIFGMGRIGTEMALRCKGAFGMNVIYHNRSRNPDAEARTAARRVSFDQLLTESDVVSVHALLSDETRGIFNAEAFRKMKSTALFINTSRGGTHDEIALSDALKRGLIWGAGLDVTNPEPMAKDNPLLFMENVVILPHIGSGTTETRDDMARTAAGNIVSWYANRTIPYCVNPEVIR